MAIAIIPFLFAVAGLLAYALFRNSKAQQIGLAVFTAAMVALMISLLNRSVSLGW